MDPNQTPPVIGQYSLRQIIGIWALSALPMGILAFIFTPMLIRAIGLPPLIAYWISMIIGLVWQFVLSCIILKREGYALNWNTVVTRMRYKKPVHPRTGRSSYWLLLWTIPFILLSAVMHAGIGFPDLDRLTAPLIKNLPKYDLSSISPSEYKGAWWILVLFIITAIFNYLLGEEFMYRGILLPKMNGVFGKWDWFANGVLFGLYHLHKPQVILSTALLFGFVFAFPSKIFQSGWMAVIIHGLEGLLGIIVILGIILS